MHFLELGACRQISYGQPFTEPCNQLDAASRSTVDGERPGDSARILIFPDFPSGRSTARHLPWKVCRCGCWKLATFLGLAFPTAMSSAAPSTVTVIF